MSKWFNDYTQNDTYFGINDASIELFAHNQMEELTREMIQNSLDAIKDESKPVIVDFSYVKSSISEFPDVEEFKNKILESKKLAELKKDDNSLKKLIKLEESINRKEINLLIVSDYNTTGLTNISTGDGSFNALLNSAGFSYKGNASGGSFGFGKNAAFLFSNLRTVFYNTLNTDKEFGFQGVSVLSSGVEDGKVSYPKKTYPKDPLTSPKDAPFSRFTNRKYTGTDVIITGFDKENWEIEALISIAHNFFYAIKKQKLIVRINNLILDHKTLENSINKLYIKSKNQFSKYSSYQKQSITESYHYIHLINQDPFERKIKYKEKEYVFKVYYNLISDKNFKGAIGIRKTGMKIHDFKYFKINESFIALIYVEDEALNQILRSMENPTHNKWEPSRCTMGENYGRNILRLIKREISLLLEKQIKRNEKNIEIETLDNLFKLSETQKKYHGDKTSKSINLKQKISFAKEKKFLNKTDGIKRIYEELKIRKNIPQKGLKNITHKHKVNLFYNNENKVYEFSIKDLKNNHKILIEFFYVNGSKKNSLNVQVVDRVDKTFEYKLLQQPNQLVILGSKSQDITIDLVLKDYEQVVEVDIYEI